MSEAFECDRCGELHGEPPELKVATNGVEEAGGGVTLKEREPTGTTTVAPPPINGTPSNAKYEIKRGDLCEDCADAFREFWGVNNGE